MSATHLRSGCSALKSYASTLGASIVRLVALELALDRLDCVWSNIHQMFDIGAFHVQSHSTRLDRRSAASQIAEHESVQRRMSQHSRPMRQHAYAESQ
jgi:hypothetical protein